MNEAIKAKMLAYAEELPKTKESNWMVVFR